MLVIFTSSPQICNLEEQLEQFREELENKSEEVQQLHMQLEIQRKEISSQQEYLETRDGMLQVNSHPAAKTTDVILCDTASLCLNCRVQHKVWHIHTIISC